MGADVERRKHKRYRCEAIISHDILSLEAAPDGKIYNFSQTGLYFESKHSFYAGEEIFVDVIGHPQSGKSLELLFDVVIVWRKKSRNSLFPYDYGARFKYPPASIENVLGTGNANYITPGFQKPALIDQDDARQNPRKPYHKPLVFNYQDNICRGLVTNISHGGAFIRSTTRLSLGHKLILVITGSKIRKKVKLRGWIVRRSPEGFAVSFNRRTGLERRFDIDRRIGFDRRNRRKPEKPPQISR